MLRSRAPLGLAWLIPVLLLCCLLGGTEAQSGFCSETAQRDALLRLYAGAGGPQWVQHRGWGDTAKCEGRLTARPEPKELKSSVPLPSHCCWQGITCCVLAEEDADDFIECGSYQCGCSVGNVTGITLGSNGLTGRLQDVLEPTVLRSLGCNLRMLFMSGNDLSGSTPPALGTLPDLRILSLSSNELTGSLPSGLTSLTLLEELDVSTNRLTGTVPGNMCGGATRWSPLRDLVLSNNLLSGSLVLPDCESLIMLDGQNNNFTGFLPDLTSYRQLHILRLGNNSFNGSISTRSFDLRLLTVLDLSGNNLTGTIPNFAGNGSMLTLVRLYNNNFSGSLPGDIFSLGNLGTFAAEGNYLTGTLPENIGSARGLSSLQLRNNSLYGTLPDSLQNLAVSSASMDVSMNWLSCCGDQYVEEKGYLNFNYSRPRLPPWLTLSEEVAIPVVDVPYTDFNYMRCPMLVYAPSSHWNKSTSLWARGSVTILGTGGASILANVSTAQSEAEALLRLSLLPWSLDPEYYLYEGCFCIDGYRAMWVPHVDGSVSMGPRMYCERIVVPWYIAKPWAVVLIVLGGVLVAAWLTYLSCYRRGKRAAILQNYYNLRKRVKGEPLGGQVSIVVTDIEGYSDLMKQSPELMTKALNLHNAIIRKARWSNFGYTVEQEGDSYVLVFYEALDAVIFCLQTQLGLNRQAWPEGLFNMEPRDAPSRRRTPGPGLLTALSIMTHSLFGGPRTSVAGQHGSEERDRSISLVMPSSMRAAQYSTDGRPDSRQSSVLPSIAQREISSLGTPNAGGTGGGGLSGGSLKKEFVLFNGIRVRMGIATALLPPGSMSKGSAVMDLAKMVSDAASGGQIMIDEQTFADIKERLEELGAVDHNGMNFKKLNAIQPPWYSCLKRKDMRNPDEALLLDMGEYTHCPSKRLPLYQLEASNNADSPVAGGMGLLPPSTPKAGRRGKGPERIHLFSVSPPSLAARAKVFGNKVTLKDEWVCSDLPYFAAPGTMDAPLGSAEGILLMPPITMAFAIVDNGKAFSAKFRRDARRVHDVCAACIRACLRCVAGGYLCRMQDGDFKYMVAFSTPQAAVEWSLLLQDVLLYADWPEAALKWWREEYDEQNRMVFRGPRMKIGVCEGSPRSIIPDHIGRADYHGASINQAARYMDAAAHGGMIAVEASLALKVVTHWQTEAGVQAGASSATGPFSAAGAVAAAAAAASATAAVAGLGTGGSGHEGSGYGSGYGGGGSRTGTVSSGNVASGSGAVASAAADGLERPPTVVCGRRMSVVQEGGEELSPVQQSLLAAPRRGSTGGVRPIPAPWADEEAGAEPSGVSGTGNASSDAKPLMAPAAAPAVVPGVQFRPHRPQSLTLAAAAGVGRSEPLPRLRLGGTASGKIAPEPGPGTRPAAVMLPAVLVAGGGGGALSPDGDSERGSRGSGQRPSPDLWPMRRAPQGAAQQSRSGPQPRADGGEDGGGEDEASTPQPLSGSLWAERGDGGGGPSGSSPSGGDGSVLGFEPPSVLSEAGSSLSLVGSLPLMEGGSRELKHQEASLRTNVSIARRVGTAELPTVREGVPADGNDGDAAARRPGPVAEGVVGSGDPAAFGSPAECPGASPSSIAQDAVTSPTLAASLSSTVRDAASSPTKATAATMAVEADSVIVDVAGSGRVVGSSNGRMVGGKTLAPLRTEAAALGMAGPKGNPCVSAGPSMTTLTAMEIAAAVAASGSGSAPNSPASMLPPPPPGLHHGDGAADGTHSNGDMAVAAARVAGGEEEAASLRRRPPPLAPIESPALSAGGEDDRSSAGNASPASVAATAAQMAAATTAAAAAVLAAPSCGGGAAAGGAGSTALVSPLARHVLTLDHRQGSGRSGAAAGVVGLGQSQSGPLPAGELDAASGNSASSGGGSAGASLSMGRLSLPPMPASGSVGGGSGSVPSSGLAATHSFSPLRHAASSSGVGPGGATRTHPSLSATNAPSTAASAPGSRTSSPFRAMSAGGAHHPAPSPAGSGAALLVSRQLSGAVGIAGSGGSVSSLRSPRPPSLTPLALPSEKERDETLTASRQAAEENRKIQVDGPSDAVYKVQVVAQRIGVFRFKGSPEDIPMAHIALEHLAGRRFPLDAPKGKGGKVADSSGVLCECEATLPDLASRLRDRYLLSRPPPPPVHLEVTRSSPSARRLRTLLGGSSVGSGTAPTSPGSPGGGLFQKTRSLASRATAFSANPGVAADSALQPGGSGTSGLGGLPSAATLRRASGLMGQLAQLAATSMRWASGTTGGEGPMGRTRSREAMTVNSAFSASGVATSPADGGGATRTSIDEGAEVAAGATAGAPGGGGAAAADGSPTYPVGVMTSTGSVAAPPTPVVADATAPEAVAAPAALTNTDVEASPSPASPRAPAVAAASAVGAAASGSNPSPAGRSAIVTMGTSPLRHRTVAHDPLPELRSAAAMSPADEAATAPVAVADATAARGDERV